MTKKQHCDICGNEVKRTYFPRYNSARKGSDSAKVYPSWRRRLLRTLGRLFLGKRLMMEVYGYGDGRKIWGIYDLCSECKWTVEDEVRRRVSDDE